jgi:hypothetical protein
MTHAFYTQFYQECKLLGSCTTFLNILSKSVFFEGLEDDSVRIKTCALVQ